MSLEKHPLRYAHSEGHTDVCYDDSGSYILTCGSEGDIRVWAGINDDDAESHHVGDKANAIAFKNGRFYAAPDNNKVEAFTFPEGENDGLITRFTAPVTHMCLNDNGSKLLAGASDFVIKLVNTTGSQTAVQFEGHTAPVLSVALDPKEEFVASSSCDGNVKIWKTSDQQCVKTIPVGPKCSDVSLAKSLYRIAWHPKDGSVLCVPVEKEIKVFERNSWDNLRFLSDSSIDEVISVIEFSPCGRYLAASTVNGSLLVWNFNNRQCVYKDKHENKLSICALKWNPKGNNEIAYCDNEGQLGLIENVLAKEVKEKKKDSGGLTVEQAVALFEDDDDDDDLLQASKDVEAPMLGSDGDNDDDDDDDFNEIRKLKRQVMGIDDDDESTKGDAKDTGSTVDGPKVPETKTVYVEGYKPTPLQRPFQPASTPTNLSHRFMVWNSVGIIRQYSTEEENSIDIEFHDTATHHAMHINNDLGHTLAAMSTEAVALACESDDETDSKLVCMHFSSWDNSKEWSISMPKGEEIQTLSLGIGWVAVGTDKRQVRIFTIGGVQRDLFSVPGPIVAMAGHDNKMAIVYHVGQGTPGDQCLGLRLMTIGSRPRNLVNGDIIPLSPKSTLAWIGFSGEGTPFIADSSGFVRMYNRRCGPTWIQVANTKDNSKSRSDHYWICAIRENPQQLMCVPCKGSTFPSVLPRPAVTVLPFKITLCEGETDKTSLEESLLRNRVFSHHLELMEAAGYEVDSVDKMNASSTEREALMKLFALACKSGREYRALEICELMPDANTVQLAIKYASRLRLLQLAERISDVARQKLEEEERRAAGELVDDDDQVEQEIERNHVNAEWVKPRKKKVESEDEEEEEEEMDQESVKVEEDDDPDPENESDEEMQSTPSDYKGPPLISKKLECTPKFTPSSGIRKNPFKVAKTKSDPLARGSSVFDSMSGKKTLKSPEPEKPKKQKAVFPKKAKSDQKKISTSNQAKLFSSGDNKPEEDTESKENIETERRQVSPFQLWFNENRDDLEEEHPDKSTEELTKTAALAFRQLTKEERKEWMDKARALNEGDNEENKKRKRDEGCEKQENGTRDSPLKKTKFKESNIDSKNKKALSQSTSSKLSKFAFGK